jgi:hypothetical protein
LPVDIAFEVSAVGESFLYLLVPLGIRMQLV